MVRKKFNGIRRRVEGERARYAVNTVAEMGFTIIHSDRLGNDTGYAIRTKDGPAINLYDTGTITVTGNNRSVFRDTEKLRMPSSVRDVLIVANLDDEALLHFTMKLRSVGIATSTAFFSTDSWMKRVSTARRRGQHILAHFSVSESDQGYKGNVVATPDGYFGVGLLIARIERDNLTVVCDDALDMPQVEEFLGSSLIRYSHRLDPEYSDVTERLAKLGFALEHAA